MADGQPTHTGVLDAVRRSPITGTRYGEATLQGVAADENKVVSSSPTRRETNRGKHQQQLKKEGNYEEKDIYERSTVFLSLGRRV